MSPVEANPLFRGRRRVLLRCGSAVYFANGNHAPRRGEVMPCLRHGYCGVEHVEALEAASPAPIRHTRAPRRTTAELVAHLGGSDAFTLEQLRTARFTLRILHAAARAGLVAMDTDGGTLVVRAAQAPDTQPPSSTSSRDREVTCATFRPPEPLPVGAAAGCESRGDSALHREMGMSEQATARLDRSSAVRAAADRLADALTTRTATPPVRDVLGRTDIAVAYEVQATVTARRVAAGRSIVGRKIGLTSPAVQAQLGVDQPDFGVLFDDMAVADGGAVDTRTLIQPKAEAEVAFVLGADLDGDVRSITLDRVIAAVDHAVGAIEIVDSRNADWDIAITDTIADNASSALYVLGSEPVPLSRFRPVDVTMTLTKNGELVSSGNGEACLGDPLNALTWLARTVAGYGSPLRAGEVVLSGALGPMIPVSPGAEIVAELSTLGRISVSFF